MKFIQSTTTFYKKLSTIGKVLSLVAVFLIVIGITNSVKFPPPPVERGTNKTTVSCSKRAPKFTMTFTPKYMTTWSLITSKMTTK